MLRNIFSCPVLLGTAAMFSTTHPSIAPRDLDTIKRAAFDAAVNNKPPSKSLPFAKKSHTLYSYYEALKLQYENLNATPVPPHKLIEAVKTRAEAIRAGQAAQEAKEAGQQPQHSLSFAQVDWQDFEIVQTVTFNARDLTAELPRAITKEVLQKTPLQERPNLVQTLASGFIISPFTGDKIASSNYDEHVKAHLSTGAGAGAQPQETPSMLRFDEAEENLRQWKRQKRS